MLMCTSKRTDRCLVSRNGENLFVITPDEGISSRKHFFRFTEAVMTSVGFLSKSVKNRSKRHRFTK